MQSSSLIYLLVLVAMLVIFPPALGALLARIGKPTRPPEPLAPFRWQRGKPRVCADPKVKV